jgi:hypothetical protein
MMIVSTYFVTGSTIPIISRKTVFIFPQISETNQQNENRLNQFKQRNSGISSRLFLGPQTLVAYSLKRFSVSSFTSRLSSFLLSFLFFITCAFRLSIFLFFKFHFHCLPVGTSPCPPETRATPAAPLCDNRDWFFQREEVRW